MTALRIALPVAAMLMAAPASAQPAAGHDQHHPTAAAADAKAGDADMHARCQGMMGARMQGAPPHDHAGDKMAMMAGPKGAPPSKDEMEAMHKRCAEMMAKTPAAPQKK